MLSSLVSSQFEHAGSFYEGHCRGSQEPHSYSNGGPLISSHFALATKGFTSEGHISSLEDGSRISTDSYGGVGRSSTSDTMSSGSTTCRSSCESSVSSMHSAARALLNNSHKSQDTAWIAINSLKLRGQGITMANLKVLRKLGEGDNGSVYLTQLRGTSCLFALKVVDKEKLLKKNKIQRVHIEREILEVVDHPFLPTLYAHFEMGHFSCLLMEFCSGGDLHALMHHQLAKRFPLEVVRFYAAQVVVALEYLHMHGIIYRDLKPENILLRDNGHIMLLDFDLCVFSREPKPTMVVKLPVSSVSSRTKRHLLQKYFKVQSQSSTKPTKPTYIRTLSTYMRLSWAQKSINFMKIKKKKKENDFKMMYTEVVVEPTHVQAMSMVGTHEYLAPEVVKGWRHGNAIDWWMLGILIYELVYGRTPFKGCDNKHTLCNIITQQVRFPQDNEFMEVDGACKRLLRELLTKEPSKRLGSLNGACEIKNHPFFKGVNWALIRTTKPPSLHQTIPHHQNHIIRRQRFDHPSSTLLHFEDF